MTDLRLTPSARARSAPAVSPPRSLSARLRAASSENTEPGDFFVVVRFSPGFAAGRCSVPSLRPVLSPARPSPSPPPPSRALRPRPRPSPLLPRLPCARDAALPDPASPGCRPAGGRSAPACGALRSRVRCAPSRSARDAGAAGATGAVGGAATSGASFLDRRARSTGSGSTTARFRLGTRRRSPAPAREVVTSGSGAAATAGARRLVLAPHQHALLAHLDLDRARLAARIGGAGSRSSACASA